MNPKIKTLDNLNQMIAEIRASGFGIVIGSLGSEQFTAGLTDFDKKLIEISAKNNLVSIIEAAYKAIKN